MKTLSKDELIARRKAGQRVRVLERAERPKAVPTSAPEPARPTQPEPLELRLVDATTVERLVLEERLTREALIEQLVEAQRHEPGVRAWRFTVERGEDGYIKAFVAKAIEE